MVDSSILSGSITFSLERSTAVLIRLKFSRRSCYTGVMHHGSENGVAIQEKWIGQLVLSPHDPRRRKAYSGKGDEESSPSLVGIKPTS